jgi:hypothetical protein
MSPKSSPTKSESSAARAGFGGRADDTPPTAEPDDYRGRSTPSRSRTADDDEMPF